MKGNINKGIMQRKLSIPARNKEQIMEKMFGKFDKLPEIKLQVS